jgi:hypothetical protein
MAMRIGFFVVLLVVSGFFSCSKDNGGTVQPPFMNCKADGATIDFNQYNAVLNGSNLQITGISTAASANVNLSINNISPGQTGTFNIGSGNFNSASFTDASGGYSAGTGGGSGTIVLTTNNGTVLDGSFQFTAQNLSGKQKLITEGRFRIFL